MQFTAARKNLQNHSQNFSGKQETGYETLTLFVWVWRLLTLAENKHSVCVSVLRANVIDSVDNCDQ